jgi:lipid II:glycine glycyltransferase (peptidoglycan interpeptide bridge formation enzyme)
MNWLYNAYAEIKIPRIELRWKLPNHEMVRPNSEFVIHTIQLKKDPDIVAKKFKRTHRQNIHTTEKRGVRIERGDQIDHLRLYYQLQIETRIRHGLPVQPWQFFEYLGSQIFTQGLGFVLLAYKEEECIAGVGFLYWQNYLVAKFAASKADTLKLRPNNLLFWNGVARMGFQHSTLGERKFQIAVYDATKGVGVLQNKKLLIQ